jgi:sugar (pentulose or hexulose) kinase
MEAEPLLSKTNILMSEQAYFIGIDLGSQGMRVVVLDNSGDIVASADEAMALTASSRQEQDPGIWWQLCLLCIKRVMQNLETPVKKNIIAVAVSSTSGTVIPLDKNYQPLSNAIMYSDNRSAKQAEHCASAAHAAKQQGFTGFNSSCGLPKILWYTEHFPDKAAAIQLWIHAADYITGKLSGVFDTTDYTNVLKTGFDLSNLCWPEYLNKNLGIQKKWLQQVVPSGSVIGKISKEAAKETGLPEHVLVTAGITDGCASQVASGAMQPGQWNTTIGTTLVIKGVTKQPVEDPAGRIYNHRHPEGYWMPGGAGNIGADWVVREFADRVNDLNIVAAQLIPTGEIAYPLLQQGERFPFIAPQAKGFQPDNLTDEILFAAKMEGVAYVERYAYELISTLSGEKVDHVFTAGGASNSDTWLRIRSAVMNKPVYKMKYVSGAVGAAIVAASQTYFGSLSSATKAIVQTEKLVTPEKALSEKYEDLYHTFIDELRAREYINP